MPTTKIACNTCNSRSSRNGGKLCTLLGRCIPIISLRLFVFVYVNDNQTLTLVCDWIR